MSVEVLMPGSLILLTLCSYIPTILL